MYNTEGINDLGRKQNREVIQYTPSSQLRPQNSDDREHRERDIICRGQRPAEYRARTRLEPREKKRVSMPQLLCPRIYTFIIPALPTSRR